MQILIRSNDSMQQRIDQLQQSLKSQAQQYDQTIQTVQKKLEHSLDETIKEKQAHMETKC